MNKRNMSKMRLRLITVSVIFFSIVIFIAVIFLNTTLSYDKVYEGVTFNGEDVSGMTKEELTNMVNNKYDEVLVNSFINFTYNNEKTGVESISFKELAIKYNTDIIVDALYKPGHEGSIFRRLKEILNLSGEKRNISLSGFDSDGHKTFEYDDKVLNAKIDEIERNFNTDVVEHDFIKDEKKGFLKIITGKAGIKVDRETLKKAILNAACTASTSYIALEKVLQTIKPRSFNADSVYDEYNILVKDAEYEWEDSAKKDIVKVPHTRGETLSFQDLISVSETIDSDPKEVYEVPIIFTEPSIKSKDIPDLTFNEVIGKCSTSFPGASEAKKHNITTAVKQIDGFVLLPGDTFSFNDYIGNTTIEKGYQMEVGFENGQRVETAGGGVCQVSTTLYNAIINGGLEIITRYSHSMKVGYIGVGMDSAVAYGTAKDISFRNNLDVPIKIVGTVSGNTVTFEIKGVNKNKNKKYEFKVSKAYTFTEDGKKYEKYITYRTVKVNGIVVEDEKAFDSSTYLIG